MSQFSRLMPILFIIILGFGVYANSLGGEFLWDDQVLVEDNLYIRGWRHLGKLFTSSSVKGSGSSKNLYRPLQVASYALDYSIWKLNRTGYHLSNLILHILVALSLFWLVLLLFGDRLIAFLSAALFVVHPVHTEAVAYISGRADSLTALFLLLSFIFYLKYLSNSKVRLSLVVILTYLLALLARENALIFPLFLLTYHWIFKKKLKPKLLLILAGITGSYIILRLVILADLLPQKIVYIPSVQRAAGFLSSLPQYLRLLVYPLGLHMEYGHLPPDLLGLKTLLGVVFLVWLLFYLFRKPKPQRLVLFSLSWFFLFLLPQSNIYPVNAYMAEHWLYLPSIGFFFILASGLCRLLKVKKLKVLAIISIVSLGAFYSLLTINQNRVWAKAETLYLLTLSYAPESANLYNNLGNLYQGSGRIQEAIAAYSKAIAYRPDYADGYYNLAVTYHQLGQEEKAVDSYRKAIQLNPRHTESHINLGTLYYNQGRSQEALALYEKAVKDNPDYPVLHTNLALIYYQQRRYDLASQHRNKVIELNYKKANQFLPELEDYQSPKP